MADKEMISVIIPAYNCGKTLKAAVDSALAQDVNKEVIIVDDCSQEDLEPVLCGYRKNPLVKTVRNTTNLGVAESRNRGVRMASGEYIAFLDADDMWRKGKLSAQLKIMKACGAVICSTARELMKEDGALTGRIIHVPELITYKMLLKGNNINCSSVLIKKSVCQEFPMESDDTHEDYIAWLKILQKYEYAVAIDEPFLLYRMVKESKSGSKIKSAKMTYKVYRRMGFGTIKSVYYFVGYAFNGVSKYFFRKN